MCHIAQEALQLMQHYELLISNDLAKLLKQTGLNATQLQHAGGIVENIDKHILVLRLKIRIRTTKFQMW